MNYLRKLADDTAPYHSFPDHGSQALQAWHVLGLTLFLGLGVLTTVLHFLSEPALRGLTMTGSTCRHKIAAYFGIVIFVYLIPAVTVSTNVVVFGVILVVAMDGFMIYKDCHRVFSRVGLRLLFLGCFCLVGRFSRLSDADNVDYIGPMRVTSSDVAFFRPDQEIKSSNPTYYYYYVPMMKFEWGHKWGCPDAQTWCAVEQFLKDDSCSSRKIVCKGRPAGQGDTSGCLSEYESLAIELDVLSCMAKKQSNATIISSFDMDVPPWEDPTKPYWVENGGNCGSCEIVHKPTDMDALDERQLWYYGVFFLAAGAVAALYGHHKGENDPFVAYQATSSQDNCGGDQVIMVPQQHVTILS